MLLRPVLSLNVDNDRDSDAKPHKWQGETVTLTQNDVNALAISKAVPVPVFNPPWATVRTL